MKKKKKTQINQFLSLIFFSPVQLLFGLANELYFFLGHWSVKCACKEV